MKRYLVFAGDDYEPGGGWHDFVIACATPEEAKQQAKKARRGKDWRQIVDLESEEIIEEEP